MTGHLVNASVVQLLEWQRDIVEELARRATARVPALAPVPPWEAVTPLERTRLPPENQQLAPQAPAPAWTSQRREPPKRMAIGAGEDGMGGGPNPLAATPIVDRPVMRPPGTIYATASTDPELAAQFARVPERHGAAVGGNGVSHGDVDLEP